MLGMPCHFEANDSPSLGTTTLPLSWWSYLLASCTIVPSWRACSARMHSTLSRHLGPARSTFSQRSLVRGTLKQRNGKGRQQHHLSHFTHTSARSARREVDANLGSGSKIGALASATTVRAAGATRDWLSCSARNGTSLFVCFTIRAVNLDLPLRVASITVAFIKRLALHISRSEEWPLLRQKCDCRPNPGRLGLQGWLHRTQYLAAVTNRPTTTIKHRIPSV